MRLRHWASISICLLVAAVSVWVAWRLDNPLPGIVTYLAVCGALGFACEDRL